MNYGSRNPSIINWITHQVINLHRCGWDQCFEKQCVAVTTYLIRLNLFLWHKEECKNNNNSVRLSIDCVQAIPWYVSQCWVSCWSKASNLVLTGNAGGGCVVL